MIHARFNDSGLMGIIEAQQRLGRADGVIEVGLRFQRRKLLAQHRCHHLLGGGLARRACDLHYRQFKLAAIPRGQRLQRQEGVLHENVELPLHGVKGQLCGKAARRAVMERHLDIIMTVKTLPHQRDEECARFDLAAVGGNGAHHHVCIALQ